MPLDLSKPKTSAGAAGGKKGGTTEEKPDAEPENAERAFREHVESVSPLKMFVFLTSPLEYLRDDHNHFDVSGGGDGRRLAVRYGEIAILRKMIAGLSKAYGVGYGPGPHTPPPAKEGDKEGVNGRTKDDQKSQKSPPSSPAEPYFLHPEADFAEAQQWADGLLLPSEIGKAREELIVGGVTLPGSSTDCPDVLIEPLRKIFGEGGTAPEEEESLEELYRRLSCKSLPYHQAKAKLLLLYHFARLPLPEAAPWLATEQAEAVMTAHRHVLAAVDIFLHARLLRFALAAMELATALVQAVLPLTGGEDVVLFRKGAKLTDKELQRRKASDLEKKYGLSTPPPSSPSSSSPPAEPIIVGRLDGATIRQISSHMTDGFVGRCFNQHIRGIRRDHLRLMRLLITFKKDEAEKEEREWMMMAAKAGRPRPPPSLLAAIARELSEDLDRFIHGTPEPKLYISQLPEPPEPKSAAGAAAAATAASSSASPEKKKKEDKKSNQMTVKLVVELKCFPRDHPEVKQSVGDVARQQAAINANIEREIQRQGLLQQYISYEEGTEKDQGKKGKKAGEEAAKYLSVLVRDGTNGGQVKVAKARMLTPAVVEELITRYCDEEGLVYGGPDPEEEEEEDGNGDGNGDGDEEEEESVEEEDDGGVETMDSGNGSGGGGTAILSYGKALGFPPERLMLPMFPKPVTEKWWLMLSTPYSGRISTVAFLVGQSGRLLLTVNVPRPVVVHAGDPNYPKVVGRVTASRKPTAYEPPSPLTEVLLLLKNSAYIGRDRLYRLHFFITRKAVRYVGAIEHHLGPR